MCSFWFPTRTPDIKYQGVNWIAGTVSRCRMIMRLWSCFWNCGSYRKSQLLSPTAPNIILHLTLFLRNWTVPHVCLAVKNCLTTQSGHHSNPTWLSIMSSEYVETSGLFCNTLVILSSWRLLLGIDLGSVYPDTNPLFSKLSKIFVHYHVDYRVYPWS